MSRDEVDLKWKAGQFGRMLEQAPYFQEVFDSHFAKGLAGIGYAMERREKKLEIKGVPEEVVQKFSRRSKEIEEKAKELKITDPKEKAQLSLSTRDNKRDGLTGNKLKERWRAELTDEEYKVLEAAVAAAQKGPVAPDHKSAREMIDYASRHLFERASVIPEHMLLMAALKAGTGLVSLEDLKKALNESDIIQEKMDGEMTGKFSSRWRSCFPIKSMPWWKRTGRLIFQLLSPLPTPPSEI